VADPGIDPKAVDPAEFAKSIATTPDEQLAEGMRSELRGQILGEIFSRMEEHFDPAKAQGVNAVMHWNITGGPDDSVDHYEAVIENGTCNVTDQPNKSARVTFTIGGVEFLKLVTGNIDGPQLFMSGGLKIDGDLMFAAQAAGLFRVPGSAPSAPA
jgi:putative sterol carrier protein